MTCSLNAEYLEPYTSSVAYTPNFQKFAADALTFKNHYTESGHSGTAFSSILTGSHADVHGVYLHPNPIAAGLEILPEALDRERFASEYWLHHPMARAAAKPRLLTSPRNQRRGMLASKSRRLGRVLQKLQEDPRARAVLTAAFTVTHSPYKDHNLENFIANYPEESASISSLPPSRIARLHELYLEHRFIYSYGSQRQIDAVGLDPRTRTELDAYLDLLYKSRVNYLDVMFGELVAEIDRRGLKDETLFVFTSDHGEVTSRPNALFPWTHGSQLAPEVLRVPLMIRAPKSMRLEAGDYEGITRSIDLFPTVLSLAGGDPADYPQLQGVDLSPHIRVGGTEAELSAPFHTTLIVNPWIEKSKSWERFSRYFPNQSLEDTMWVGLRSGDWVFKWRPDGSGGMVYEAFDHATDPDETTNRYSIEDPQHLAAGAELRAYRGRLASGRAKTKTQDGQGPDEEEIRALRALGYVE